MPNLEVDLQNLRRTFDSLKQARFLVADIDPDYSERPSCEYHNAGYIHLPRPFHSLDLKIETWGDNYLFTADLTLCFPRTRFVDLFRLESRVTPLKAAQVIARANELHAYPQSSAAYVGTNNDIPKLVLTSDTESRVLGGKRRTLPSIKIIMGGDGTALCQYDNFDAFCVEHEFFVESCVSVIDTLVDSEREISAPRQILYIPCNFY